MISDFVAFQARCVCGAWTAASWTAASWSARPSPGGTASRSRPPAGTARARNWPRATMTDSSASGSSRQAETAAFAGRHCMTDDVDEDDFSPPASVALALYILR